MRPACRVGDFHVCPGVVPAPHVGGPLLDGYPTVIVENRLAGRLGSHAMCSCALDMVMEGAATVLMGGLPAAAIGFATAHGGRTVVGSGTVFVGGPSVAGGAAERLLANELEIQKLRERIRRRKKRIRLDDEYLEDGEFDPDKKLKSKAKKRLREIGVAIVTNKPHPSSGLPPGAEDWTEQEMKTRVNARDERAALKKAVERDEERLDELERENGALRSGKDPPHTQPKPGSDDPIKSPVTGEDL